MDVTIGGFHFSISKQANNAALEGHQLDQNALDGLLDRLAPLPGTPSPELFSEVLIEDIQTQAGSRQASTALKQHGIFIVPNFFDRELALEGGRAAFAVAQQAHAAATQGARPEGFILETSGKAGYYAMATSEKTVVNLRKGSDAGLVDIFNFDRVAPESGRVIRDALGSNTVMEQLSASSSGEWRAANLNAYVNQNVMRTRMFHVDSYGIGQVKAFLYLTDVNELADGPYCYVADSHMAGPYRDMNLALARASKIFSSTDTPIVDIAKILPILAPAGSLVVSNQSGAHRGAPQGAGHSRAIAVLNILPAQK